MSSFLAKVQESYKAIVGAVVALAAYVTGAYQDGSISWSEWSTIGGLVASGVVALVAVWWTKNQPPAPPQPLPPPTTEA